MIEEIKLLLGDAAKNYTDAQIGLAYKMSLMEVEEYCKRTADAAMEYIAERIAVIKLLRMGSDGLAAQSYSGVSETYIDGLPEDIQKLLNGKRKIKVV
jgi:hypothetical protein